MYNTIIDKKASTLGEIIVTLFEHCNLACSFCSQNHNSFEGVESIPEKYFAIKSVYENLRSQNKEQFSFHFMGGEILSDSVSNQILSKIESLILRCQKSFENSEFLITSNMIWSDKDRVKQMLDRLEIKLAVSYDPAGRFNTTQLEQFMSNVEYFKDYITTVNIILTAPNIYKFLGNDITGFDYLYNNFNIYFDYYTPEKNASINCPTDVELLDIFKYLSSNYPKVAPINKYLSGDTRKNLTCQRTKVIAANGEIGHCNLLVGGNYRALAHDSRDKMEAKWIEGFNCLMCDYFDRCGLGCFQENHILPEKSTMEHCWIKDYWKWLDGTYN